MANSCIANKLTMVFPLAVLPVSSHALYLTRGLALVHGWSACCACLKRLAFSLDPVPRVAKKGPLLQLPMQLVDCCVLAAAWMSPTADVQSFPLSLLALPEQQPGVRT